jgi:inner membrane protein
VTTLVTHAALPWLARSLLPLPAPERRRLLIASALCACAPDLDVVSYLLSVPPDSLLAHRGLTHSLAFAVLLAFAVAGLGFRANRKAAFLWLFAITASHGLFDALTHGEVGVALFAPFDDRRWSFPWNPVPVMPLGLDEFFGRWGIAVVFDEALLLLVPSALLVAIIERVRGTGRPWGAIAAAALGWVLFVGAYRQTLPELAGRRLPRIATHLTSDPEDDPAQVPLDGLPDGGLSTSFTDWQARGLVNTDLRPSQQVWSAEFFPSWFGREAGRWRDGTLRLAWRTIARVEVPRRDDPTPVERRSPTEKYDLLVGDEAFTATRAALEQSHNANPRPRFWHGLCNGVAAAALAWPEPHLAVDAIGPAGQVIRFHPNDVKALLAASYYWTQDMAMIGGPCKRSSLDNGRWCSMNPAALAISVVNRVGLAHRSFLIDVYPSPRSQFYAVASARLELRRAPYPLDDTPLDEALATDARQLVDVAFTLQLSSTTLSPALADQLADDDHDGTHYREVGLHAVPFTWDATLAIDQAGNVIGGRWTGPTGDGPDSLLFESDQPLLTDAGVLEFNQGLDWKRVEALARASAGMPDAGSSAP